VLGVARHPRVGKTGFACRLSGELDGLLEAGQASRAQPGFDRREQLGDARLRRIHPVGLGDEVDLAAVQPLRDDLRLEPEAGQGSDGRFRGGVERGVLRRRRLPPLDELDTLRVAAKDLGAAVHAEMESSRPGRPRPELPVDVADVRSGDDRKL
jgi:hypothetical protein